MTFKVPVNGVEKDNASGAPVTAIGPRTAVQLMSAFCRICSAGFLALPAKLRGTPRSAASRIAASEIETGTRMVETRSTAGSGGKATSAGARA